MKNIVFLVLIVILLYAFSDNKGKEVICSNKAPMPIGPYSQAIRSGGMLYVSGQIALTNDGGLDSSSIENETKQVLNNIKAILEAANLKMQNINKVSIFTTNLKHFAQINAVYQSYFKSPYPARETIQVSALPKGAHIEISVMAD
ncbi:MAG: Rid family detoxifying hydrolase [Bacteroidota bacterium]